MRHTRTWSTLIGIGTIFSGLLVFHPCASAQQRVSCQTSGTTITCRIDEPFVRQRVTEYRNIIFQPGDRVTIDAGGCAQTGGRGSTWKRYVDPQGPDSGRLYYGLIWIPGATAQLVRIEGVLGGALTIPSGANLEQPYLRLGYEDDDYGDNGYWGRDNGWNNQCRNVGNAFVTLTIERGGIPSPEPPPGTPQPPLNLLWDILDENGIPGSPKWQFQVTNPPVFPGPPAVLGPLPDPNQLCGGFPYLKADTTLGVSFGTPPCTTQLPQIDIPSGFNNLICTTFGGQPGKLNGHVNWGPAVYEGAIYWKDHDAGFLGDDDYNFRLWSLGPFMQNGLTTLNNGSFGLEFDSDETIDNFTTPWWVSFREAVDAEDISKANRTYTGSSAANQMIDGRYAIVTGLFGLDCEHDCKTELHPLWVLAINVDNNSSDNVWAIFVRNWGNEGYCSQDQHYIDLRSNTLTLRLPWRSGASSVTVRDPTQTFKASDDGLSIGVDPIANRGVLMSISLLQPEAQARLHGELHLRWSYARQPEGRTDSTVMARPTFQAEESDGPEKRAAVLYTQMTSNQRHIFQAGFHPALHRRNGDSYVPQAKSPGPDVNLALRTLPLPRVRAVRDSRKLELNRRRLEALCEAYGGKIPGFPSACNSTLRRSP